MMKSLGFVDKMRMIIFQKLNICNYQKILIFFSNKNFVVRKILDNLKRILK